MLAFLWALSAFDLAIAAAAAGAGVRLATTEGRNAFASPRLYWIAALLAWTLPAVALAAIAGAWTALHAGRESWAIPLIMAPLAWLIVMGTVFAIVDLAEDGVLDFGRKP